MSRYAAVVLTAVGLVVLVGFSCARKTPAPTGAAATAPPKLGAPALTGVALGKQIFTTGVGTSGSHVPFTQGSERFRSDPGGCGGCHGANGQGKNLVVAKTPAISYAALGKPQNHLPALSSDAEIKRAITEGIDAKGKPLPTMMPRWQLTDEEFTALVAYLKTLDTGSAAGSGAANSPAAAPSGTAPKSPEAGGTPPAKAPSSSTGGY